MNQDWKRWLATLCVVLLAFLYLEPVYACSDAAPVSTSEQAVLVGDGCVVHTHDADPGHADHERVPEHDGAEPHVHHCMASHTSFIPNDVTALSRDDISLHVTFSTVTSSPASNVTLGLDRPPRTLAFV